MSQRAVVLFVLWCSLASSFLVTDVQGNGKEDDGNLGRRVRGFKPVPVTRSSLPFDFNPCMTIRCANGYECDPHKGSCVAVTCDAQTACPEDQICIPEDITCITTPCPQFHCSEEPENINPCIGILCIIGDQCDPLTGTCVPVTCDSPDACEADEVCEPADIYCIRAPCPQFTCKKKDEFGGECVVCPLIYPMCDEDCKKCKVRQQTCHSCASAKCMDHHHQGDDCLMCTQSLPKCQPNCDGKCVVHPQTCHSCSYAECKR